MATVRVFQNLDGSVRVMRLNDKHRLPGETDDQFFARETTKQSELSGLSFIDVQEAALPNRSDSDSQGDHIRLRAAWRVVGNAVQANPNNAPPGWEVAMARLDIVLPAVARARMAGLWSELRAAITAADVAYTQALYDELKAQQAGPTPPLTVGEFQQLKTTFTVKRLPITL